MSVRPVLQNKPTSSENNLIHKSMSLEAHYFMCEAMTGPFEPYLFVQIITMECPPYEIYLFFYLS